MNEETKTPVVEETIVEETVVEGGKELTKEEDTKVDYVKIRVDRAKAQTEKTILKDLGVDSLETAKKLIQDGTTALSEVEKLKNKIEQQEQAQKENNKRNALIKILDVEKVFDSEALVNYIDLEKIEIDDSNEVKNKEEIIASLKKAKPNFFGKFETVSDNYVKGQVVKPTTAIDKQKAGNTIGAINDYLKEIIK